jgi:hypothetical protein
LRLVKPFRFSFMRNIQEIKTEQDQALLNIGFHLMKIEQHQKYLAEAKQKVFVLADEAQKALEQKEKESAERPKPAAVETSQNP